MPLAARIVRRAGPPLPVSLPRPKAARRSATPRRGGLRLLRICASEPMDNHGERCEIAPSERWRARSSAAFSLSGSYRRRPCGASRKAAEFIWPTERPARTIGGAFVERGYRESKPPRFPVHRHSRGRRGRGRRRRLAARRSDEPRRLDPRALLDRSRHRRDRRRPDRHRQMARRSRVHPPSHARRKSTRR